MIPMHELWQECRWGLYMPPHKNGLIEAMPFRSARERDAWVAQNPDMRQAVGKRHPAVKAFRQRQS
jgi:hypothetical protein